MITNKDVRVENGNLVLNGDKYPLDGQSPETIMEIVEDNSDSTPTENSTAPITSGGVFTADKDIIDTIGDITQTGVTGADVAAQISALKDKTDITKVPDSFITLGNDIAIVNNGLYKEGNHVFGWITFSFAAQTPNTLILGTLNNYYKPTTDPIRMNAGLGTENWASEYNGYAIKGVDQTIAITGYNANIKAAHIHLDYVIA